MPAPVKTQQQPQAKPSLEATISAAYDEAEADEGAAADETVLDQSAETEVANAPAGGDEEEPAEEPSEIERSAAGPVPAAKPAGQQGKAQQPGAKAAAAPLKPPASWKASARAKWAALPPEVQQEVARVGKEVDRVLQESASARRMAENFEKVVTPYRALMDGEPLQVVGNLLQTAASLRTGTRAQRAAITAQLITAYDVSVEDLATILEGKQPAEQSRQQEIRDPRFDKFLGEIHQSRQRNAESTRAQASAELATFAESHEFLDEVREDMAALMAAARQRGKPLTLEQAYGRACMANEEVRPLYEQRKAALATATAPAATRPRARVASSSLRHNPSLPSAGKAKTLAQRLEETYDELSKSP